MKTNVDEARDALLMGIASVLYEMHPNDILNAALHMFIRVKLRQWGSEEATSDDKGTPQ